MHNKQAFYKSKKLELDITTSIHVRFTLLLSGWKGYCSELLQIHQQEFVPGHHSKLNVRDVYMFGKYFVSHDGTQIKYFKADIDPSSLTGEIDSMLG